MKQNVLMELIRKYLPGLDESVYGRLGTLGDIYRSWNDRINVISRKDIGYFYERHVLHSLSVALVFRFLPGTKVLDAGTGGGFPGIPLAIVFPDVMFTLADSVGKKIRVVKEVAAELGLKNVEAVNGRFEKITGTFDFVVSRAVASLPVFIPLAGPRVARNGFNEAPNGIIYLKGGDFDDELVQIRGWNHKLWSLSKWFEEPFFATKKMLFLSRQPIR